MKTLIHWLLRRHDERLLRALADDLRREAKAITPRMHEHPQRAAMRRKALNWTAGRVERRAALTRREQPWELA